MELIIIFIGALSLFFYLLLDNLNKKSLRKIEVITKRIRTQHPVVKLAIKGDRAAQLAIKRAYHNIRMRKAKRFDKLKKQRR